MFNKIYSKIKLIIKENYKFILFLLISFFVLTYRLPIYIYVGGGIINLDDRISLNRNEKGSYNMAYVGQIEATIPTYLLSFFVEKWDVEKIEDISIDNSETANDIDLRLKLYLEEGNQNAIISAYTLANKEVSIKKSSYKVIYVNENSDTNIKIGDELISVNGVLVEDNLKYKEVLKNLEINSKVDVKVLRDNKEVNCYATLINIDSEKVIGLYLINILDYKVSPDITIKNKSNESGSSGGFMTSLAIYDRLISEDLTKGRKIVGTGTIDKNGNIGEISGVKYKLMGAEKEKADIFFVSKENYEEAINTKNKYNYKIKVIKVETLEDAVNYLKNN